MDEHFWFDYAEFNRRNWAIGNVCLALGKVLYSMAEPLFNMSRTLSIGNEGPRALEFALGPVYLGRNPRWTAHVWFDARSAV